MIKLLIFDLDNTLFDTYGQLGTQILEKMISDMKKAGLNKEQERFLREKYMLSGFRIVARQLALPDKVRNIGLEVYKNMDLAYISPFDDVKLLKEMTQTKILVTSGIREVQMKKIGNLKIGGFFKEIIVDEASTHKNKQRIFAHLLEKYNLETNEAMVVGDNPESELAAGSHLKMVTVQIHRREIVQGKADYHIKDLYELQGILEKEGL